MLTALWLSVGGALRSMRAFRFGLPVFIALTGATAIGMPAQAEGFFSKLLGWGQRQVERNINPPTYNFGYSGQGDGYERSYDRYGYGGGHWPTDNGRYRTLCVRTCDGFYFPIGDGVGRERLHQDARTCESRCTSEARLYYYPVQGGSPETMVDLAGRPYVQERNAFLYRKQLVSGCTCKAPPWSAESAARHRAYKDDDRMMAEMRRSEQRYAGPPAGGGGEIEAYLMRQGPDPLSHQSPWDGGVRRY